MRREKLSASRRLTERCSPGYASLPSSELWDDTGTDRCYWFRGAAILELRGGGWLIAEPYHYAWNFPDIVTTPKYGPGYLCDAEIDTDAWIESVLGVDVMEELAECELGQILRTKIDRWIDEAEWDHHDVVGKLCRAHNILCHCERSEGGAA